MGLSVVKRQNNKSRSGDWILTILTGSIVWSSMGVVWIPDISHHRQTTTTSDHASETGGARWEAERAGHP